MRLRRARGLILRLVRRRPAALVVGLTLAAAAMWLQRDGGDEWWIDGLSLILGATGIALAWTAVLGAAPDWIDPES